MTIFGYLLHPPRFNCFLDLLAIAEVQGLPRRDIHLRSQLPYFWVVGGW